MTPKDDYVPPGKAVDLGTFPGCEYADDEKEFIKAVDSFKLTTGKKFPTLTELLNVLKALGYRKVQDAERKGADG